MAELKLFCFGAPRIERDGRSVALRRTRAIALLVYLALTGQPQERERLLGLLWPEFDAESARNNLRRELSLLRTAIGETVLVADRLQVAWNPQAAVWIDVAVFQAQLGAAGPVVPGAPIAASVVDALTRAVQLARDDLLAGFSLPDCPAFEEWQFFQREGLRQQLAAVLPTLSAWHCGQGAYERALSYARRWLALDPLHEPAQRELMRIYALAGQYAAALRQYEEWVRLLDAEFAAAPEAATQSLFAAIKARRVEPTAQVAAPAPATAAPAPSSAPRRPISNLPPPLSGFVGRERECADLVRRLTDPDCRLLTLVGPGGIGKTQLALRAAQEVAVGWAGDAAIADGVLFVPLAAVASADEIVTALAAAAQFAFYPGTLPQQQLIDYLRAKQMLVVLDNFEQLRDAVGFVVELLAAAPGLRLLVTSREALNLQEEWFHPLDGLSFPSEEDARAPVAQLARFDAVLVFEQHARRFQSDFSLSRAQAHVVRLCRLVAGMPLAIELAASWLKVLTVEQIVAALERDLDILTARTRDLPERHRSMRTVLEETVQLLEAAEQQAFAGLSVFSGSFTVAAAGAVGGVGLPVLASLVEHSLLRTVGEGRFQLHELLRQFAAEVLAADPPRARVIHTRHSTFYLAILADEGQRMTGPTQQAAVVAVAREAENVRAAWQWACAQRQIELIDKTIGAYHSFLFHRSAFQEGRDRFSQAVEALRDVPEPVDAPLFERVWARAYIRWGAFCFFVGDHTTATEALARGLEPARRHGLHYEIALARLFQGAAAGGRGEVALARSYLGEALAIGRASGEPALITSGLNNLAQLDGVYGDFAEGKRLAEESVALNREAGESDRTAYALVQLAWLSACRGEYAEAEQSWREALELFERIGNQHGMALGLGGLGYVAWCVGGERLAEAQEQTRRSLELLRKLNHRLSMASRLSDLALIELDRGDHRQAELYSQEGLALARQVNSTVYVASHLAILGQIMAARHEFARSRRHLGEALSVTVASSLLPRLASTCYQIALLAVHEAATLGADHPLRTARQTGALALLTAISEHQTAMHVYRARARALGEHLRRELPPDLASAAHERGRGLDLQAGGEQLLALCRDAG